MKYQFTDGTIETISACCCGETDTGFHCKHTYSSETYIRYVFYSDKWKTERGYRKAIGRVKLNE